MPLKAQCSHLSGSGISVSWACTLANTPRQPASFRSEWWQAVIICYPCHSIRFKMETRACGVETHFMHLITEWIGETKCNGNSVWFGEGGKDCVFCFFNLFHKINQVLCWCDCMQTTGANKFALFRSNVKGRFLVVSGAVWVLPENAQCFKSPVLVWVWRL